MKYQEEIAGNKYKDARQGGELKQHVPITVQTKTFPFAKRDTVGLERN